MRVALLGDIALFGKNTIAAGSYQKRMLKLREVLSGCDYVVCNLETPLTYSNRTIGGKSAYIKGSPEDVRILTWLGVTHACLANNHMYDYRRVGLDDTISCLESVGIAWYGADRKGVSIEGNTLSIMLRGYCCYSTNPKGIGYNAPCVDVLDPRIMEKDINDDEELGRLTVMSCHWGQEHVHVPSIDHMKLIRHICQHRRVIVHGHHPHVLQGIESESESLVIYSLGNCCFDDVYTSKSRHPLIKLSRANEETCVVIVEVTNKGKIEHEIIPFSFTNDYVIDNSIKSKIEEWSSVLALDYKTLDKMRSQSMKQYIDSRKKLRDFEWYFKRMNLESARMIRSARMHRNLYEKTIKSWIAAKELSTQ